MSSEPYSAGQSTMRNFHSTILDQKGVLKHKGQKTETEKAALRSLTSSWDLSSSHLTMNTVVNLASRLFQEAYGIQKKVGQPLTS